MTRQEKKYKHLSVRDCEYIYQNTKYNCMGEPEEKDGRCLGYRNRYTKQLSNVCRSCEWLVEE